jgi:hypothetical protein
MPITVPLSCLASDGEDNSNVAPGVGDTVPLSDVTAKVVSVAGGNATIEIQSVNGADCAQDDAEDAADGNDDEEGEGEMPKDKAGAALLILARKQDKKNGLA